MSYLVDTDIVADYLLNRPDAVALLDDLQRTGLSISSITYLEIVDGILGNRDPGRARNALRAFLRRVRLLVISRQAAERAAQIRVELRRQKRQTNERSFDILVAATAIEHGLTLVTRNTRDYADIPGVALFDRI
jgi:tRNA(fMet)-specific endonuclease VapC